jgi:ubiquinone/menaquinone biosynthesis C-methylase UbiE
LALPPDGSRLTLRVELLVNENAPPTAAYSGSRMTCAPNSAVERLDLEQSGDRLQLALHQQRYDFVLARLCPEDSVLEVGTGTGGLSQRIASKCREFKGLEYDASACELTHRHLQGRAAVFQGDAQAMPFSNRAFSVIVCLEVLEHLEDYGRALSEVHRCLRPEGQVIISVPYRRHGGLNPSNPFHIYEPGEAELVSTLRQYFTRVETLYQYFEESAWMTLARVFHLRSLLGLASIYRDLVLGTPQTIAKLKIAARPGGWKITLLLLAAEPRLIPLV